MKLKPHSLFFIFAVSLMTLSGVQDDAKKEISPAQSRAIELAEANKVSSTLVADYVARELSLGPRQRRKFIQDYVAEREAFATLNETVAKMLRWENPIGKRMAFEGKIGRVVGVIKDFNNLPPSLRIEPVTLIQSERNRRLLAIKIRL